MPRYDYTCAQCGHLTEVLHGIHDTGPAVCPSCGAVGTMRKGFAAPAVHFKGSGWAKKDRSTASSAMTKAKAASEGGSSASGGDSGGDSGGKSASGDSSSKDSSGGKSTSGESSSGEKKAAAAGSGSSATASAGSSGRDD